MDQSGSVLADWLGQSRRALAQGAASRSSAASEPALHDGLLQHLGQALAAGRVEIFVLHTRWLAETLAARHGSRVAVRELLLALREELEHAVPAAAWPRVRAAFTAALDGLETVQPPVDSLLRDGAPRVELARRYLLAVLEARLDDAVRLVLDAAQGGASIEELIAEVVIPVQQELGRMWQCGEASVAEEHLASQVAARLLTLLDAQATRAPRRERRILVACVEGNDHDFGARLLASAFERQGWQAILLGANTPAAELATAVEQFQPDLIALSAGTALHVRATAATVAAIRARAPGRTPILVGGGAFAAVQGLWRDVGADGTAADAASALAWARESSAR
ncbi:MAG: cobalamin-dependent protein [Planctomycetes bacterium]|nr:cobalamin-dependent protein [Planctomycetota bacterium]